MRCKPRSGLMEFMCGEDSKGDAYRIAKLISEKVDTFPYEERRGRKIHGYKRMLARLESKPDAGSRSTAYHLREIARDHFPDDISKTP